MYFKYQFRAKCLIFRYHLIVNHSVAIIVNHAKIRTTVRSSLNARGAVVSGAINLRKYADTPISRRGWICGVADGA